LKRFSFVLPLLLLGACASENFETKSLSEGFKGNIDYVRDAFGQPITRIPKQPDAGPFPSAPVDVRPEVRTQKERTDLIAEMKDDHATAAKVSAAVAKSSDQTRYISFNGKPPAAQPIALTEETVKLPDGVRDIDTVDPTRLGGWSDLGTVDFKEGSAELPESAEKFLAQAAHLASSHVDARIVGYSASDRLALPGKGPHESDRYLADLRARKVAEALIRLGVAPTKLVVGPAVESDRKSADKVEILIDY
jgi:outer membrane protein OmpA-like peptidoglycan-associated protein